VRFSTAAVCGSPVSSGMKFTSPAAPSMLSSVS
jgi:hypothetical protein